MISAGDFRNGITLEMDNGIFQIIEFQHVKPVSYTHLDVYKRQLLFQREKIR